MSPQAWERGDGGDAVHPGDGGHEDLHMEQVTHEDIHQELSVIFIRECIIIYFGQYIIVEI